MLAKQVVQKGKKLFENAESSEFQANGYPQSKWLAEKMVFEESYMLGNIYVIFFVGHVV